MHALQYPKNDIDVALIRSPDANPMNQVLLDLVEQDSSNSTRSLVEDIDPWQCAKARKDLEHLREIVEDAAEDVGLEPRIHECQLRRRCYRDAYTTDFAPLEKTIDSAHVTVIREPTYAQVRYLCQLLQRTILQRVVVLFDERERIDDLIEDLALRVSKPHIFAQDSTSHTTFARTFFAQSQRESEVFDTLRQAFDYPLAQA